MAVHRSPSRSAPPRPPRPRPRGAASTTPPTAHASPDTPSTAPGAPQHPDTAHLPLPGMAPRREPARTARARQLTCTQPPLDLDRVRTYHDHGCLHQHQATALPSGQGECGGPLRFQNVVRLSSHTNKEPPGGSPCDHRRARCRYTPARSSRTASFNRRSPRRLPRML